MKILARYISGVFIKNFLLSASGLTILYAFQAMLGRLLGGKYPAYQVIFYHSLELPQIFVQMTPPAVLMATVLTLSGLTRTNELVACFSIGVGLRQLMVVVISLVFMISCFTVVLQDRLLPPLFKRRTFYYYRTMKNRTDFFLDIKKDKIWYRSKNLIYNLKTFDPDQQKIRGMSVYSFDQNFRLIQVVNAQEADYTAEGWKLNDGVVTIFDGEQSFPKTKKFNKKELLIDERPEDFQELEKEVEGLRIKELYHYIQRTAASGIDTKTYEVKFHYRISLSFIPLVMCLLAIPFSTKRRREGGMAKDLGLCMAITFFYWLFYAVSISLGENGALPPLLAAWLPSLVFVALATGMLVYKQE